jgi:transcriptional regulator with XRE-family HTH domain
MHHTFSVESSPKQFDHKDQEDMSTPSPDRPSLAWKLMTDATTSIAVGELDRAADLVEQAMAVEPALKRQQRKLPQTVAEMMPLLRRQGAAAPVLTRLRQSFGLTQYEIADICGVTQPQVARWECGRHGIGLPAMEKLVKWIAEQGISHIEVEDAPSSEFFAALRKALGFTTTALAAKLGLKEPQVRRIELDRLTPSAAIIARYRAVAAEAGYTL